MPGVKLIPALLHILIEIVHNRRPSLLLKPTNTFVAMPISKVFLTLSLFEDLGAVLLVACWPKMFLFVSFFSCLYLKLF